MNKKKKKKKGGQGTSLLGSGECRGMTITDDIAVSGPISFEPSHCLTQLEVCTPMLSLFVTIEHGLH